MTLPFWETKSLKAMTDAEWESLCDGCGRCCMVLLEETDTGRLYETNVACKLFDVARRRCTNYAARQKLVKDCVKLTPGNAASLGWMPETCAYRRLARGEDLPDWHPLLTGTRKSVEEAGVAIMNAVSERTIEGDEIWDHVTATRPRPRKQRRRR
ncbi:MAG: YcgN family cysteine cluster protein [Parvularculaceae bacterium]|nr:YcgN family cysteine cluster protein [Parvularculaceae bacterium]